ncbi:folate family ECF transporter S component [Veillonella rodentium]|uniref:Folate ECF transporter S component FolT n=1 Tax=Veillonella rodentium TaxID=248315 RepID=A0A239ZJQ3_9FIRM|nr:folate family ECF transporter S component [Veillonella rodentium]SNV70924.1 Folate ECF transporter S component FolT [Veillonella rodentium]
MKTDMVVKTGIFIALTVLLSYIFAIHTTFIHITFGFLSTAIFGILYGPMAAGIMAAIACFIGMSLFGHGVFFPGFIVSEFLVGYVYGYFLHGRDVTLKRLLLPELIVTVCIHLVLNTLWLTIFYNKAVSAIFLSRLIKNILCFPLEIALILIVYKAISRFIVHKKL